MIMPPGFHFPNRNAELWTPLQLKEEDFVIARIRTSMGWRGCAMV